MLLLKQWLRKRLPAWSVAWISLTAAGSAATVTAPAAGDLILAFRAGGGTGGSESYLINIGNDLNYRNAAPGSSFEVTGLGNLLADLNSTYGTGWHSRTDLYWGVFGTRTSVSSTVYASRERNVIGEPALAWISLDSTERNGTSSQIASVISNGYAVGEATVNSPVATRQSNTSTPASYSFQVATPGTTDFGSLSGWDSIEGRFDGGAANTALDLFRIATSGVSNLGTFTISNTGALRFTAVPEPTAGLLLLGSAGWLARRRQRRTAH